MKKVVSFEAGKSIRGIVFTETGEIQATRSVGLLNYNENIKCNVNDAVNTFPYTEKDRIILSAKKALNELQAVG